MFLLGFWLRCIGCALYDHFEMFSFAHDFSFNTIWKMAQWLSDEWFSFTFHVHSAAMAGQENFGKLSPFLTCKKVELMDTSTEYLSSVKIINAGGPQNLRYVGPSLTLIMHTLMIFPIKISTTYCLFVFFFADDTSLYVPHTLDLNTTQHSLQQHLNQIHHYGQQQGITFNAAKRYNRHSL